MLLQCLYRVSDVMRTVVKKWGNSASVRIPTAVMQATHLVLDEAVDVREESGRILIEPIQRKVYDLAEPVKRLTHENLRDEADFVGPVGTEGIKARTGQINQDLLFKLSNSGLWRGQAYRIGILLGLISTSPDRLL